MGLLEEKHIQAVQPATHATAEQGNVGVSATAQEQRMKQLLEIERCARGVVRTAHPEVTRHGVVTEWWKALCDALQVEPTQPMSR